MAENVTVEQQLKPTPKHEQIAERWMRMKGIQKPTGSRPAAGGFFGKIAEGLRGRETTAQNPATYIPEAYDLFVEKEELKADIVRKQRETMEPKSSTPLLTLEQKKEAIRQGRIGVLLSTVSATEPYAEVIGRSQGKIKEIDTRLDQIFSMPGMYEKFKEDLSGQVRIRHQAREVRSLNRFTEQADILAIRLTREAQVQGRSLTTIERQFIDDNQALKQDAILRRKELLRDSDVFDRVRILELQEYQTQIQRDRFAETPSRKTYLQRIEGYWAEAKKVLLTGETGTGKTEMVKHASNMLFGVHPESVTGHQDMSIYELLGKTGFRIQEGDVFRPAPLVRAMIGREGRGQPFLFDEIDRAPNQSVMGIKTILNARPGEKGIRVQTDSAGSFNVGPDYAVAATANIKSEKYATATELDPAIVRVFDAPMDIDYMPALEVYDLALALLMDKKGGIPLSGRDARIILKNLCDAASWIQDAYQGRQVVTDPSAGTILEARGQATTGRAATLKKALLDPGRTLDMLKGWTAAQVKGISFEDHLNQRVEEFINNRAYPDEDRYYLTEIFALKGFLKGSKPGELMVTGLTQETLDRWSGVTSEPVPLLLKALQEPHREYLAADRVAKLDPYRRFKRSASAEAKALLPGEDGDGEQPPTVSFGLARFQAVQDIIGDITSTEKGKAVHFAYINKLNELGNTSASLVDKKRAIEFLEGYDRDGAYKNTDPYDRTAIDFKAPLTDQAVMKAAELRKKIIEEATDLTTIKEYTGDFTDHKPKTVYFAFINKVHGMAINSRSPDFIRQAAEALESYARDGVYKNTDPYDRTAVDFNVPLTDQAANKAAELRAKMLSIV